jgi:hypothetical protein
MSIDYPVLVSRAEALSILGVTDATFARLRREGRFEQMVMYGPGELYRTVQLQAHLDRKTRVTIASQTQAEKPTKSMIPNGHKISKFAPHKRKLVPGHLCTQKAFRSQEAAE